MDVALASLRFPRLPPTTVNDAVVTRIPSNRSSTSRAAPAGVSAAVSTTGAGRTLPVESCVTTGLVSSVTGAWSGSDGGTNSEIVPVTSTRAPTAASAGGADEVKT